QISDDDTVGSAGNTPPPSWKSPPESTPNFLTFVNIDKFCLDNDYSYGELSNQRDINFTCFTLSQERSEEFSGQAIFQTLDPVSSCMNMIDRMANHFDPTSLQCYNNLKLLGPIASDPKDCDDYCKQVPQYTGVYENKSERTTAYDWLCQP